MEFTFPAVLVIPLALGLLGFVEPCTVGAHLLFLRSLSAKSPQERIGGLILFVMVRGLTMGAIGIVAALLGHFVTSAQTTIWLIFGSVYTLIGLAYLFGRAELFKAPVNLAPSSWKATRSPIVLGFVFGLNIPACAAPILFGLFGLAAAGGSVAVGFAMMALFGFALSVPLFAFAIWPKLARLLEKLFDGGRRLNLILGVAFVLLGLWSIWFGVFVDPADWSKL